MLLPLPPELLSAFSMAIHSSVDELSITGVGGGLINHSFRVNDKSSGRSYFLQKINETVFTAPGKLEQNYLLLYHFSREKGTIKIPAPVFFPNGKLLFTDRNKGSWRAMEWIANSKTIGKVTTPEQAAEVAITFAQFTLACKDLDASLLQQTIPSFHDLSLRYDQFLSALENAIPGRKQHAADLISELKKRSHYRDFFERIKKSPLEFPARVMHHDAKISNILFDAGTGKAWGPVDLDTVMPGYYFSDLGDMIRSLAGNSDENDIDFPAMRLREDYYKSITENYSAIMKKEWTSSEMEHIHASGLLMIYMQALRFLSDYLLGDRYYQVTYSGQNYERAKNQFVLLQLLESYLLKSQGYSL